MANYKYTWSTNLPCGRYRTFKSGRHIGAVVAILNGDKWEVAIMSKTVALATKARKAQLSGDARDNAARIENGAAPIALRNMEVLTVEFVR